MRFSSNEFYNIFIWSQKNYENRWFLNGLGLRELFTKELNSDESSWSSSSTSSSRTLEGRSRTIFVRAVFSGSATFITFVIRISEATECTCGIAYIHMTDIDKAFELLFTRWSCDWSESESSVCHTIEGAFVIWTLKNFEIDWVQVAIAHTSLLIFVSRVPNLEEFFGILEVDNFTVSWNENQILEWHTAVEGDLKWKLLLMKSGSHDWENVSLF